MLLEQFSAIIWTLHFVSTVCFPTHTYIRMITSTCFGGSSIYWYTGMCIFSGAFFRFLVLLWGIFFSALVSVWGIYFTSGVFLWVYILIAWYLNGTPGYFLYYCAFVIYYLYHKTLFWQKNNNFLVSSWYLFGYVYMLWYWFGYIFVLIRVGF